MAKGKEVDQRLSWRKAILKDMTGNGWAEKDVLDREKHGEMYVLFVFLSFTYLVFTFLLEL